MTPHDTNRPGELELAYGYIRTVCLVCSGLFVVLVATGVHDWWGRMHTKEILHIAFVNPDGRVLWSEEAGKYTMEQIWIENTVQDWIEKLRTRSDDARSDAINQNKAYQMADQQCYKDLQVSKKAKMALEAETNSTLMNRLRVSLVDWLRKADSKTRYKFWWTEQIRPLYGNEIQNVKMEGTFTVEVRTSKGIFGPFLNVGDLNKSPLGIFVMSCTFSRIEEAK